MSDEMQIEGKSYISSKRAAELSGYAQDYIGQLARKSLVDAHRIGGLWYVFPESLENYKKKADTYKPEPPVRIAPQDPATLISFDGREYLSAAGAAEATGYTQDYVGQLARAGTILSRQVGNRWYVDRQSILNHKKEKDSLLAAVQSEAVGVSKKTDTHSNLPESLVNTSYSGSEPLMNYFSEEADLMPNLGTRPEPIEVHVLDLKPATPDIKTDKIAEIVPIKKIYSKQAMLPARRKSVVTKRNSPISGFKLLTGAVATIVILLSVGYVSALNKNAIYAFNFQPNALPASTVSAFSKMGDMLEPYLTRELVYQRSENQ